MKTETRDVVVIGGGQAGLALGYYLRRTDLNWMIVDDQEGPGGAWRHTWDSLRLFSPARWSSLPGRLMDGGDDEYPTRDQLLTYLAWYEDHYELGIDRPTRVSRLESCGPDGGWVVHVDRTGGPGRIETQAVLCATGTWTTPRVPDLPGRDQFAGLQLHSAHYRSPEPFQGGRVAVVGAGNSAAQILAELSHTCETLWCTLEPPAFLPDEVDGRYLFEQATIRYRAQKEGRPVPPPASLGDVVMVASVRDARERGVLRPEPMFDRLLTDAAVWRNGRHEPLDGVVWATGFSASLGLLKPLGLVDAAGRVRTEGTRSLDADGLWLVGYGGWTGFASATLIGVGRTARATVAEVVEALAG